MFLVCGEALWDLFSEERADGLGFSARAGGSPFNVAFGLARLGQAVGFLSGVSTDPLGERLAAFLGAEGVSPDFLVRTARSTTLSVVTLTPDGQPAYAFYGEGAADRALTPDDLPTVGDDVWGVHAGSFSLVAQPVGDTLLSLFEREAGRRLMTLDPNVRLNVEPDPAVWRDRIGRFLAHTDVAKVSDEDLGLLYPGRDGREIAEDWLAAGVGLVIITRGGGGAEVFARSGRVAAPGRAVDVVDTVGAGDTFQAALIAGLAELGVRRRKDLDAMTPDDLGALAGFAVAASALTCGRRGADLPRRAELPALAG